MDIGDLLYCRVLTGNKDMEPELVCIDGSGKANGLGVLKEGFMFKINLELGKYKKYSAKNNQTNKGILLIIFLFNLIVEINRSFYSNRYFLR